MSTIIGRRSKIIVFALSVLLGLSLLASVSATSEATTVPHYEPLNASSELIAFRAVNVCCQVTMVYDPASKIAYAINAPTLADGSENANMNIYAINATTNHVIARITGKSFPGAHVLDPSNHELYVSYCMNLQCSGKYDSIAIIKGTKIVESLQVKSPCVGGCALSVMVYDPASKEIFVQIGGPNVTESYYCVYVGALDTLSNRIVSTWNLVCGSLEYSEGIGLGGLIYNPSSGDMAASGCFDGPDSQGCTVYLINPNNKLVENTLYTAIGGPGLYDPANKELYAFAEDDYYDTYNVALGRANTIVAYFPRYCGGCSYGGGSLSYSPANKQVYCAGDCWLSANYQAYYSIAVDTKNNVVARFSPYLAAPFWYNPASHDMYAAFPNITSGYSNKISVIDPRNQMLPHSIPISYNSNYPAYLPLLMIFDPLTRNAYISNGTMLFVVNPRNSIVSSSRMACSSLFYDPSSHDIYCSGDSSLYVIRP